VTPKRKQYTILLSIVLIALLAHSVNMNQFPFVDNDEGTYLSQAWSWATSGNLAPYRYWYDHAPAGWILIGIWSFLTGGFFSFGWSYESGRMFMLVLQIINTVLVYALTRRITRSDQAAIVAGLLFSLSPLGVYFHRRILLDNIMVMWFLLSYYLLLYSPTSTKTSPPQSQSKYFTASRKNTLPQYYKRILSKKTILFTLLSGVLFAIAILTKESALIFVPWFFFIMGYLAIKKYQPYLVALGSIVLFGITLSTYPLFAYSQGELFSLDSPRAPDDAKVSLVDTFKYQTERSGGFFLTPGSDFRIYLNEWLVGNHFVPIFDPWLVGGGLLSLGGLIFLAIKKQAARYWLIIVPALLYLFFLMRGGIIFNFYIIPLLPFLSMALAVMIDRAWTYLVHSTSLQYTNILFPGILFIPLFLVMLQGKDVWLANQTAPQRQAAELLMSTAPREATLLIENYAFVDFRAANMHNNYSPFPNAHFYWKVDTDPEVQWGALNNDWRTVDYLLNLPQMAADIRSGNLPLTEAAFDNSTVIHRFEQDGMYTEVRRVEK